MAVSDERYVSFTTFRRSGDPVSTPVWVVPVSDGRIGFWTATGTGKTKRLRNDPRVTVQPCDVRGRVRAGTEPSAGTAEMVRSGRLFDEVQGRIRRKYGLTAALGRTLGRLLRRGAYADTVVLVRLDD